MTRLVYINTFTTNYPPQVTVTLPFSLPAVTLLSQSCKTLLIVLYLEVYAAQARFYLYFSFSVARASYRQGGPQYSLQTPPPTTATVCATSVATTSKSWIDKARVHTTVILPLFFNLLNFTTFSYPFSSSSPRVWHQIAKRTFVSNYFLPCALSHRF